ncbi:hypothetical protein BGZ46_005993 [Entomortierella lignicola]|nr:hypothetical protein BGZ46_005993 [Entomortierella lignicola]
MIVLTAYGQIINRHRTRSAFKSDGAFYAFARVPRRVLREGYYSIIWSISPKHLGNMLLKSLVFEAEAGFLKYKLWAKLSEEQINSIDTSSGIVRLRLQQKLHLRFDSQVTVRLFGMLHQPLTEQEATTGLDDRFGLHYVELERLTPDIVVDSRVSFLPDYIVESPGQKQHILDVKSCVLPEESKAIVPYAPSTAQIFAIDITESGTYVAVLSATLSAAYVGIWDLTTLPRASSVSTKEGLELHRRSVTGRPPLATATMLLQEGDYDNMRFIRIAISTDGTCIAVYQQPHEDDVTPEESTSPQNFHFPFRIFRLQLSFAVAEVIKETPHEATSTFVEEVKPHRALKLFVGYGKFMAKDKITPNDSGSTMDTNNSDNQGDYFIACTESKILLYDAFDWRPLYGIAIGGLPTMNSRSLQLRTLFHSIEGPSFVWWEDAQNVSIWDLVSGANHKYISVRNFNRRLAPNEIEHIVVSKNGGKVLVLAGKDWIKSFFMDSGIEICGTVIKDDLKIMDINFLDEGKRLLVTLIKSTSEQSSVIMDALNLSFPHCAKRQFPSSTYSIQHVTRLSEKAVVPQITSGLYGEDAHAMMVVNGNDVMMLEIPQPGVYGLGGTLMECNDDCGMKGHLELNSHEFQAPGSNITYRLVIDFEERDIEERRQKSVRVILVSIDENKEVHQLLSIAPEPWTLFDIDEGVAEDYIQASFLGYWAQFVVVCSVGFQIWNLPDSNSINRCELALAWTYPRGERSSGAYNSRPTENGFKVQVCLHGEIIQPTWINHTTGESDSTNIRIPKNNWITRMETLHCINSVPMLISCYYEASSNAQDAIVRYIIRHINQEPPEGTTRDSIISKIARASAWTDCSGILNAIFTSDDGKWIPRCSSPSSSGGISGPCSKQSRGPVKKCTINPIILLFKNSRKEMRSLPLAEQIIDYCIQQAKLHGDPAFLVPVLECLHLIVVYNPEIAISIVRRSAFIPVNDRDFVVNNCMVSHQPHLKVEISNFLEIKRRKIPIYESPNSVFQLKSQLPRIRHSDFLSEIKVSKQRIIDPLNGTFKRQVYVAPYSLLWHSQDRVWDMDANVIMIKSREGTKIDFHAEHSYFRMVIACIVNKINPWSRKTVRANFSDLEYFDNPAVEALLKYKWNSFAHVPWAVRFTGQLIYYALVLAVTFIQVYPHILITQLRAPLIAIIALGALFLYLEFQQFSADRWKYIRSPYNLIDVVVFLLPAVGSIQLLINIPQDEGKAMLGNSRVLSFSILMVYTHLLFEMRIIRGVCNIVTIILSIVGKIQVFFAIFALSIFAFTHSILHLLMARNQDCLGTDGDGVQTLSPDYCPEIDTDFPKNYAGALSATYFILVKSSCL